MLALVGSGEYLPEMDPVDRYLLGLIEEPRVVCLPTAAGTEGDAMIDDWAKRGVDHFSRLGAAVVSVRVWDKASANDAALAERISQANFVYLSGGKPGYLYDSLKDTLTWQAIIGVINSGGLLAGCSAGAMIQGEVFAGFPRKHDGFALWPKVNVIPHFDEIPGAIVSSMRLLGGTKMTIVGVDGYTALVRQGETYQVVGTGGVTIWTKEDKTRYTEGPLPAGLLPG